jgi:PTS system nitrogen regulatory IIA component
VEIVDILTRAHVSIDVHVASKKAALEELARLGASNIQSLTPAQAFDSLVLRERLGSTGLGNGIAIPHGRIGRLEHTVGAFIRTVEGVDFDSIDGTPVNLFFALFVPVETTEEHLAILAKLAEVFSNEPLVDELRRSLSSNDIHDLLVGSSVAQ